MKTAKEAIDWIEKTGDVFGFKLNAISEFIDYESYKYLGKVRGNTDIATKEEFDKSGEVKELTKENVVAEIKGYMDFAWEKCVDERGLSANRSIYKMQAWLFLLEDEKLLEFCLREKNYPPYGAPMLRKISEKYGCAIPKEYEDERGTQEW